MWEDVPKWANDLGAIGALILVLGLWLSGRLVRRSDCDDLLKAELEGVIRERDHLEQQRDQALADVKAWREACRTAGETAAAAQSATRALLDANNISIGLLGALRDSLGVNGGGPSSDHRPAI